MAFRLLGRSRRKHIVRPVRIWRKIPVRPQSPLATFRWGPGRLGHFPPILMLPCFVRPPLRVVKSSLLESPPGRGVTRPKMDQLKTPRDRFAHLPRRPPRGRGPRRPCPRPGPSRPDFFSLALWRSETHFVDLTPQPLAAEFLPRCDLSHSPRLRCPLITAVRDIYRSRL